MDHLQQLEIPAWEANVNIPCVPSYGEMPVDGDLVMCLPDNVGDLKSLEIDTASASNVLETTIRYAGPTQRFVGVCYVANSKLSLDGYTDTSSPAAMTVAITGVTAPWNLSLFPWKPLDKLIVGPVAINETTGAQIHSRKSGMGDATLWSAHPFLWDGDFIDGVGYNNIPDDVFAKLVKSTAPFTLMPLYARVAYDTLKANSVFGDEIKKAMYEYDAQGTGEEMIDRLSIGDQWAQRYLLPEWENYVSKWNEVEILEAYFMMVRCLKDVQSITGAQPGKRGRARVRL